jgi:hypothetical protein
VPQREPRNIEVAALEPVAEITDKAVARKMLAHVGMLGDDTSPWPARGPPDDASWIDDDQRWPGDTDA